MDDNAFDRIVKAFAATSARRQALRASLAGAAATALAHVGQDAEAKRKRKKKKKKNQCAQLTAPCTSASSCCDAQLGQVACRAQLASKPGNCAGQFPGLRCCSIEAALCNPNVGNCACCDDLVCILADDGKFRCEPSEP